MFIKTDPNGRVLATDYFGSGERLRGQAVLSVIQGTWHVFLPHSLRPGLRQARAYPVAAEEEEGGWMWCVDLSGWCLDIPACCIQGPRPLPPEPGQVLHRQSLLHVDYVSSLGPWFFGAMTPGMQSHPAPLRVTRHVSHS